MDIIATVIVIGYILPLLVGITFIVFCLIKERDTMTYLDLIKMVFVTLIPVVNLFTVFFLASELGEKLAEKLNRPIVKRVPQ